MKPMVKILIVTDDGLANGGFLQWRDQPMPQAVSSNSREFHLGEFVRVLQETPWVGFDIEITKAHRTNASPGLSEAALKADRGADVIGFRFNSPFTVNGESRTLANYDMILFFPINASNGNPALAAEAEAIAQYMENGGGFFATGDHANLGAELASLIPRVRSMRRWYFDGAWDADSPPGPGGEPPAPPPLGFHRIDTTRKGADNIGQFEDQSDEFPQEIFPTMYDAGVTVKTGYTARKFLPHPLLCSPDGMVQYLPDHMHEGLCEVPDKLKTRTFKVGGVSKREYPDYTPSGSSPGFVPEPLAPEIVALGKVLPGTVSPALDTAAHTGSSAAAEARTFGIIGAWDGHRVDRGRVVVDSTWHHFFNINLTGDRYLEDDSLSSAHSQKLHGFFVPDGKGGRVPVEEYQMIMWYYRNIVYYLIPKNRVQHINWFAMADVVRHAQLREELGAVVKKKEFFRTFTFPDYVYLGQLAESYLSKARGHCATYTIHVDLFKPKIPWWEWIQDYVDIWDPIPQRARRPEISEIRLLGALGVGPQPDIIKTLTLGAAVVSTAQAREEFSTGREAPSVPEIAERLLPSVLEHARGEYVKALRKGAKVQQRLEKILAENIREPA